MVDLLGKAIGGLGGGALNSLTNASIDGLVNGTVDTALNYTWSSIFNSTYNKNGTEGAVVETVINLIKSDTFRPFVLPLVILVGAAVGAFLYWKKLGCCSCCCCHFLQPRGLSECGACSTCPYTLQGATLRKQKRCCGLFDPRTAQFLHFRATCQADSLVYCIHCTRCGDKFVGETARTLDKCIQGKLEAVDRGEQGHLVAEHFSRPDHSRDDFRVQVVEVAASKLSWDRKASKERWMKKLGARDAGQDSVEFLS